MRLTALKVAVTHKVNITYREKSTAAVSNMIVHSALVVYAREI